MIITKNVSLQSFNTFGIDAKAKSFCDITSIDELQTVLKEHHSNPLFILGGGSNMLLTQDIDALVLHINLKGIKVISETENTVIIKAMAGENWHDFVLWCLDYNYGGVENMSLIPGNIGTSPIQNIGAYGVELKDVFVSCEALNIETQTSRTFTKSECKFGYRESIFKNEKKNKYIILNITLKLNKNPKINVSYGEIKNDLRNNNIKSPTVKDVSEAIISIRKRKLPDPKKIGNCGSFFNWHKFKIYKKRMATSKK